jgi:S-ribosylhomocysteine lyase
MVATYARNSEMGSDVVYFGPMGCQTGFYLLVRNSRSPQEVFALTKQVLQQTIDHKGEVFGAHAIECGHYENLSLEAAQKEAKSYLAVLNAQTNMAFTYPE